MINSVTKNSLLWIPEKGIGHYPVDDFPYDQDYFEKYKGYADTDMGRAITQARIDFVARHYDAVPVDSELLTDVGIGCGDFVSKRFCTLGFDVNPIAKKWLKERRLFRDIYTKTSEALTFWDSFEHIKDPAMAIQQARTWVFVSIPIFTDVNHILKSKHYRKDEHYWYFTGPGFVNWFDGQGFHLVECNEHETALGRENIMSFAFRRNNG